MQVLPGRSTTRHALAVLCVVLSAGTMAASSAAEEDSIASSPGGSGRMDAKSIQRAMHYEWMLGVELNPETTACLDTKLGASWPMPSLFSAHATERLVDRVQRAHEECGTEQLDLDRRSVTASFRQAFKEQLRIRRAQEATKEAARSCMKAHAQPAEVKRCLKQNMPALVTESSWPAWLVIFERFRDQGITGDAGEPG